MDFDYYDKFINFKTKGRCDVTPIYADVRAFSNLIEDLARPFEKVGFNTVVGLDALGFVLGGAIAFRYKKRFVPMRKGGKLPGLRGTILRKSFIDYSKQKKTFEMNKGSIKREDRALIVDEWIETGTQVKAAIALIEKQSGTVIGISVLNADRNKKTEKLFRDYNLKSIK